jgi:hypothetical protein
MSARKAKSSSAAEDLSMSAASLGAGAAPPSQPDHAHVHVTPLRIRWRIVALHFKNWSVEKTVEALGLSKSTVYAILQLFDATGDGPLWLCCWTRLCC